MAAIPTPPPQQQPFNNPPQRQGTQPPFTVGIAAGAEDVKYQAKYKDLKRKVKEIEADNDKLHFKVLQAKRSIQRMKLERAVLYERLQQVPPSPEMQDRHALPPVHPSPHQPPQQHHNAIPPNHTPPEYIRGRIDSPMAPAALTRRGSQGGPIQFMQHLPPVQQDPHRPHPIHASPHMPHPHARERSPSRGRPPPIYHPQYPEVQSSHPLHSPPLSERERRRHPHELHELTPSRHHQNAPVSPSSDARTNRSAIHAHQRMGPGTYITRDRDRDEMMDQRERGRERIDQRGLDQRERDKRDWEAASMARAIIAHGPDRSRQEYPPDPQQHRRRDEQAAPAPAYYPERRAVYSRSSSVGSASGSGSVAGDRDRDAPSRPDSRGGGGFYDAPAPRGFRLRPVAQEEAIDFVHEDGRGQPPPHASSSSHAQSHDRDRGYAPPPPEPRERERESRKRSRNDMDVDDGEDGPPPGVYGRHSHGDRDRERERDAEARGKRYHPSSDRM